MLRQFDSLHGAFATMGRRTSPDKVLGPKELRAALAHIGPATSDAFFSAVGLAWPGGVSLAQLFRALMDAGACPEAFVWELRCRLVDHGLWPHRAEKVRSLVWRVLRTGSVELSPEQHLEHFAQMGRDIAAEALHERLAASPAPVGSDTFAARGPPAPEAPGADAEACEEPDLLNHQAWLKLCSLVGLTLFEARRLLRTVGNEAGVVSLQRVLKLLRGLVTPEYSLSSFVAQVLEHYECLSDAFRDVTLRTASAHAMRLRDFSRLASELGLGSWAAMELWAALVAGADGVDLRHQAAAADSHCHSDSCSSVFGASAALGAGAAAEALEAVEVSEQEFVRLMLDWAPDSLNRLKLEMCERFGSLSEGRRALMNQGLAGKAALTPRCLSSGLRSVGVTASGAEVVLHRVRRLLNRPFYYQVTLDDVVEKMRCSRASAGTAHDVVEGDILHVWQHLRAVKASMRQGTDGDAAGTPGGAPPCWLPRQPSTPSTSDGSNPPVRGDGRDPAAPRRWADLLRTSAGSGLCTPESACGSRSSSRAHSEAPAAAPVLLEPRRPAEGSARARDRSRSKTSSRPSSAERGR